MNKNLLNEINSTCIINLLNLNYQYQMLKNYFKQSGNRLYEMVKFSNLKQSTNFFKKKLFEKWNYKHSRTRLTQKEEINFINIIRLIT